jgi:epsilon-lactone hydrolase
MPVAAVPAFPWADLSMSGTSVTANLGRALLSRSELVREAAWFAGDRDPADPAVSPLFGSFRGFPRSWIPVGTHVVGSIGARTTSADQLRTEVHPGPRPRGTEGSSWGDCPCPWP